jgi:hypothetical protein
MEIADCELHIEFGIPYVWHKECGAQIVEYKRGQSINVHDLVTDIESSEHECESFEGSPIPVHDDGPYRDPATGEPVSGKI